jgi:DNA-binding PadR family transcriptional regulator
MPDHGPFPIPLPPLPGSSDSRGRARFFALGEVRLAVLSLLLEAPRHGYQLMKDLGTRLGECYQSSAGTVYPALKQLQKEGLIASRTEQGRHVYRLTRDGRDTVRREAKWIGEIWSRASSYQGLGSQIGPHTVVIASPLQEVLMAGLQAAKWSSGNPDREDRVRSILRQAAAQLRRLTAGQIP